MTVTIGPIQHSPSLCAGKRCRCWCLPCSRQHSHPIPVGIADPGEARPITPFSPLSQEGQR